jgi:hypothetical protein
MSARWMTASLLLWLIAGGLGMRLSGQSCSSCPTINGTGLAYYGEATLGSCGTASSCVTRDCTAFYNATVSGTERCVMCAPYGTLNPIDNPQSSLACVVFSGSVPACNCSGNLWVVEPAGAC